MSFDFTRAVAGRCFAEALRDPISASSSLSESRILKRRRHRAFPFRRKEFRRSTISLPARIIRFQSMHWGIVYLFAFFKTKRSQKRSCFELYITFTRFLSKSLLKTMRNRNLVVLTSKTWRSCFSREVPFVRFLDKKLSFCFQLQFRQMFGSSTFCSSKLIEFLVELIFSLTKRKRRKKERKQMFLSFFYSKSEETSERNHRSHCERSINDSSPSNLCFAFLSRIKTFTGGEKEKIHWKIHFFTLFYENFFVFSDRNFILLLTSMKRLHQCLTLNSFCSSRYSMTKKLEFSVGLFSFHFLYDFRFA